MALLAAQGQRSGKYRHIFGDPAKPEKQFQEIKNPLTSGEARYVMANKKYFAVARGSGGGPVYVHRLDQPGRFPASKPVLSVHKGKAWDFDFHPFIDNMIATASDDCSLAVTAFPDDFKESITQSDVSLTGHGKKVVLCRFSPTANSILASASFDRTVRVWNIETQSCVSTFKDITDNIYSLEWNFDGSQLAVTGKDKKLRLFDPRQTDDAVVTPSFEGTKSSKCFWMPNLGWIGATGFSKTARRQIRFWDLKNMEKPIFSSDIDQVGSVLMPFYDNDTGLLFTSGKGEGSVNYAEVINDNKKYYPLGLYRNPEPQKGGGWVPKAGLDVFKCEIARFLKLTQKSVIPISFIVPRKSGADVFQEDIFPDCFAGKPAMTADEWLSGSNKDPEVMSMNPENRTDSADAGTQFVKKKTYQELEAENEALRQRVKELEQQLGINNDDEQKEDDAADDQGADNAGDADDQGGDD